MKKRNGQPQNHPGRPKGPIKTKNPMVRAVLEAVDRAGYTDIYIANRAGLESNELSRWRTGEYDNPGVIRICWVLEALGMQFWIVDKFEPRRPTNEHRISSHGSPRRSADHPH
jgi:transcriptional regulator with XRE-family HTH domain